MKKTKMQELYNRVDEILYYLWDPIGVNDEPAARSEYSSYVRSVISILDSTEDISKIAKHLNSLGKTDMGLLENKKHALKISEILIGAKEAIEEGLS